MTSCIIVGLGGFVGSVLRYLIGLLPYEHSSGFPLKTFFINILGALLIGAVAALAGRNSLSPRLALFLKVGICGGFTTFSSFALESQQLVDKGAPVTAALYMGLSLFFGILACIAGQKVV